MVAQYALPSCQSQGDRVICPYDTQRRAQHGLLILSPLAVAPAGGVAFTPLLYHVVPCIRKPNLRLNQLGLHPILPSCRQGRHARRAKPANRRRFVTPCICAALGTDSATARVSLDKWASPWTTANPPPAPPCWRGEGRARGLYGGRCGKSARRRNARQVQPGFGTPKEKRAGSSGPDQLDIIPQPWQLGNEGDL